MPKPRAGQNYQDFINSCVEDLVANEDRKPDQARAICESLWQEQKIAEALKDKLE